MSSLSDILGLFILPRSSINGTFIPDVVLRESNVDTLTVTDHPVEKGAEITDHSYKNPSEVIAEYAWTDSRDILDTLADLSRPGIRELYSQLLELQETREPMNLITNKRAYKDMLITSLHVTTDASTNEALMLTATFRRILIVTTQVVSPASAENQEFPEKTGGVETFGVANPREIEPSTLPALPGLDLSS